MKNKKAGTKTKQIKRCGVFDREKAKKDGKEAMDVLWGIATAAGADFTVTEYEAASYQASLEVVEQELQSLVIPPGEQAILPDDILYEDAGESAAD
jgi:hypothetical protein